MYFERCLLILFSCLAYPINSINVIKIAGLYSGGGEWFAPQMRDMGEFAKDLINNSTIILPDSQLSIDWKDSECMSGTAVEKIIDFLEDQSSIYHFVLGPACSISAEPVGEIIPNYYLNMIAYSAGSPGLTSSVYPNTFLGIATYNVVIAVSLKLVKFYQWRRVALMGQDTGLFNTINLNFAAELTDLNIQFDIARLTSGDPNQIDSQLERIFDNLEYKVVFGSFYELEAYEVLCRAYLKGYVYPFVTWLIPSWYTAGWTQRGRERCSFCEGCDIEAALRGVLGLDALSCVDKTVRANNDTILGLRQQEIWNLFSQNNVVNDPNIEKYLPFAFDSLLSFSVALDTSLRNGLNLSLFDYHDQSNPYNNMTAESLRSSLSAVNYAGLTGNVVYLNRARQYSDAELSEYFNGTFQPRITIPNVGGDLSLINTAPFIDFNQVEYEFFGKQPGPLDGVELHYLPTPALATAIVLAIAALFFSVFFLCFNLIFHKKKVIRYSNPVLNSIMLVGACLQCGVAILVLLDNRVFLRTPEEQRSGVGCFICTTVCHLVWWVPALATDIIFGTLIGKSLRIFLIVVRKTVEHKFKLIYIIILIGCLMLCDTLYTIVWGAVAAIRFQYIAVGPEQTDLENIQQPGSPYWYIFYCAEGGDPSSPAIAVRFVYILFRWVLYAVGLYFAFQIRKVQIRGVNEFQAITLATFVTIFFNLVRIILITMIPSVRLIDSAITLLSISYSLDTICVVGFIFVPKLYFIIRDPHQKKNYTGVRHASRIDDSALYKIQIKKIENQLELVKEERDQLLSKLSGDSIFTPSPEETPDNVNRTFENEIAKNGLSENQ